MKRKTQFGAGCGVAIALVVQASPSFADDAATAQALFDQARKAMAVRNFAEACPKFDESLRIDPALGTLLNLADCYEREGKLATAWSRFLELASKARAAGQTERARIGHDRASALATKLSNVVIEVEPSSRVEGLEIRRDKSVVGEAQWGAPIPTDSGLHRIEASAPGRTPWSDTVTVGSDASTVTVRIPALAALSVTPSVAETAPTSAPPDVQGGSPPHEVSAAPTGQKTAAYIVGGIGVLGLAVGGVFGVLSILAHNDASNECPATTCKTQHGSDLWSNASSYGTTSTIAFIAGGAAMAGGVVLWLTAPKGDAQTAAFTGIQLGPTTVRAIGTW